MSSESATSNSKPKLVRVPISEEGGTCAMHVYPNPQINRFFYCPGHATSAVLEDDDTVSFRCREHRGHLSRDERDGTLAPANRIVTEVERRAN